MSLFCESFMSVFVLLAIFLFRRFCSMPAMHSGETDMLLSFSLYSIVKCVINSRLYKIDDSYAKIPRSPPISGTVNSLNTGTITPGRASCFWKADGGS